MLKQCHTCDRVSSVHFETECCKVCGDYLKPLSKQFHCDSWDNKKKDIE